MEPHPPSRDEEIASFFANSLGTTDRLASSYGLSQEEAEEFGGALFGWFHRYTRRSGNDGRPLEDFRERLLLAAASFARDFKAMVHPPTISPPKNVTPTQDLKDGAGEPDKKVEERLEQKRDEEPEA